MFLLNFPMKTAQAGDGVRTHDIQLGKLALYQLSYTRATPALHPRYTRATRPNANVKEPQIGIEPMTARLRIECSTTELLWRDSADKSKCAVQSTKFLPRLLAVGQTCLSMPSRGLEPRCLSAQAPQACVSTNFTTRAV